MKQKTTDTILPEGIEIDLDGKPLSIEKRLSAGLTGEVYRGSLLDENSTKISVAIKVMKSLEFAIARQMFMEESERLAFLMHLEEAKSKSERPILQRYGIEPPKVAPIYYGRGEYEGTPFFVMEFINGETLPSILERKQKLPELQALILGWHLFRTLDILHKELKKTYIDLKFEDLWWIGNKEGSRGQLKLTDFGTLEDINERGMRRDLLLSSVFLMKSLTGYTLKYSLGELRERAKPVLIKSKDDLSWGTYHLLTRLLHRNPAERPSDAAAISEELRTLVMMWWTDPDKQLETAEARLGSAETNKEKERDLAILARSSLDIIQRMDQSYDKDRVSSNIVRADSILNKSDYLERGKALLLGRSYELARQVFEKGRDWSDEPAVMRRWMYLAICGERVPSLAFDARREEAIKGLELMNQERWDAASKHLSSLSELESPGYQALLDDCNFSMNLDAAEQARDQDSFAQAAKNFELAWDYMRKLPDSDFIKQNEVGDLLILADDMKKLAETRGQAEIHMGEAREAIGAGNYTLALTNARKAISVDRNNTQRLDELRELINLALTEFRFDEAFLFSDLGNLVPHRSKNFEATKTLTKLLKTAQDALPAKDWDKYVTSLIEVHIISHGDHLADAAIEKLLEIGRKLAIELGNERLLKAIAFFYENTLKDETKAESIRKYSSDLEANRDREMGRTVDRLIAIAVNRLKLEDPEFINHLSDPEKRGAYFNPDWSVRDFVARLKNKEKACLESLEYLKDAAKICRGIDYAHQDDLTNLIASTNEQLEKVRTQANDRETESLEFQKQEFRLLDQMRNLVENQVGSERQQSMNELIYQCQKYLQHFPDDDIVRDYVNAATRSMDALGKSGWEIIRETANQRISAIEKDFLGAQKAFEEGQYEEATLLVERLQTNYADSEEWQDLKNRLIKMYSWKSWQENNHVLLEMGRPNCECLRIIREFLNLDLPRVYYQSNLVFHYLDKAHKYARQEVQNILNSQSSESFTGTIRNLVDVEMTKRIFLLKASGNYPPRY